MSASVAFTIYPSCRCGWACTISPINPMSSPKWNGNSKTFNPNRTFMMSESSPSRKFNPKSTFMPSYAKPGNPTSQTPAEPTSASENVLNSSLSVPQMTAGQTETMALYHPPLHPLQYQLFAPTPFRNHLASLEPHERRATDFSLPEDIQKDLFDRNEATLQIMPALGLPEYVYNYHSLVPLDLSTSGKDKDTFGCGNVFHYKAISHVDARTYCLLRIDDFESQSEQENSLQVINRWKRVSSSAIVGVIEAFTSVAFGTAKPSLVVVYEWYPCSEPLSEQANLKELSLWQIAAQVIQALTSIHLRGLSCKGMINEKYILTHNSSSAPNIRRVRLSSLGVKDILGVKDRADDQKEDFRDLAAMISRLGAKSTQFFESNKSELESLISALNEGSIDKVNSILAPHLLRSADYANRRIDDLEDLLARELANGRLVRLMAKMEFALSGHDITPLSAYYPLVLFKKFVFGQHTVEGKPSLNLAHAIAALNKMDAAINENVLLVSSDNMTRIILSYKDLNQMFTKAFDEKVRS